MALSEFDLIRNYFSFLGTNRSDVVLGVGDDCALLRVPEGRLLAVSVDTLVCGHHFLPEDDPESLGHKSLAVNLSDLAAMGADPAWVTLALTLPRVDRVWLEGFARGLSVLADRAGVALIGGDTTCGPLSVTLQVHGFVEQKMVMPRSGARPGDLIYVSGELGDAALALRAVLGKDVGSDTLAGPLQRLHRPEPRLDVSRVIRGMATACIDVSDGLIADLGHICESSGVSAHIVAGLLPLSPAVRGHIDATGDWRLPLAGGDDYELCFTIPPRCQAELESLAATLSVGLHPIGRMKRGEGVCCQLPDGTWFSRESGGYDHFASEVEP